MAEYVSTVSSEMPAVDTGVLNEVCLSTAYLAPVSYFQLLSRAQKVVVDPHEYYQKQSYRNRCRIATANGPLDLIIPVEFPMGKHTTVREVRLSDHGDWRSKHWKAIASAYNSSPFFEYYADELEAFYSKTQHYLWEFNSGLQDKIIELMDLQVNIVVADRYISEWRGDGPDLRELLHPKKELSFFDARPYYQVFAHKQGFLPGLSAVDLLFNMGNESVLVLEK